MNIYEKNLNCLKTKYPMLYNDIVDCAASSEKYEIHLCKDGNKTVRIKNSDGTCVFLHSKYFPKKEAVAFSEEYFTQQSELNILYGFGLGYHVIEIFKKLKTYNQLFIFETNIDILKLAFEFIDFSDIINDKRVRLFASKDISIVLSGMQGAISSNTVKKLVLHVPSVQTIPEKYSDFRFLLEDWNIRKSVDQKYSEMIKSNSEHNIRNIKLNVGSLFNKFIDIPFLIVSSGPSLDKNIHLVKEAKGKAVIMCAGTSLKPLLKVGVKPDFIVMIDPQEITYEQIRGIEDLDIPCIFLLSSSGKSVREYKGPKLIAIQDKNYLKGEDERYLVKTGGSVATASMDIALKMGGNPVIFIGQDLAYTDNKHHLSNSMHEDDIYVNPKKNMRKIVGIDGTVLNTTLGMLSFKKWIENRIQDEKNITFINSTEGGSGLEGAIHIPLSKTINKYLKKNFDIDAIIRKSMFQN